MPLSRSRDYLSIGEVLESIRSDFPDVSISKIRFLEAEGLIAPERTSSGYRKFYTDDVKRLRYILSLQRDQFLPLKVIRERLAGADAQGEYPETPAAAPAPRPEAAGGSDGRPAPALETDVQLSRAELGETAGLSDPQLRGLEEFGLLETDGPYSGDDLAVAKAARRLFDYGLEPRHLRMYKQWAEREATVFEQIVIPGTKRKDPESQSEALRSVQELLGLSRQLREAMLRTSLRQLL